MATEAVAQEVPSADPVSAALREPPDEKEQYRQDFLRSRVIMDVRRALRPARAELTRDEFSKLIQETRPSVDAKRLFYSLLTRGMLVYSRTFENREVLYKVAPPLVLAQLAMERRTAEEELKLLGEEIAAALEPLVLAELQAAGQDGMDSKAIATLGDRLCPDRPGEIWEVCEQLVHKGQAEYTQPTEPHMVGYRAL